jgi:predicted Zn-dependent protease
MNKRTLERTLDTALTYHKAGQHTEAAKLYAQVCRAAPRLFDGWYLAGTLAVQSDRPADAVPLLLRALQIEPTSSKCRLFLGMALADTGRFSEAEKPLRAGLQKHPDHPAAWENLAKALTELGRSDEAEECWQRVRSLQPLRLDFGEKPSIDTELGRLTEALRGSGGAGY